MTDATRPVYSDSRLAQPPLLFISGQVPLVGGEVPDDIGAQTAACLDRIERLLGERSVGMDRLVKVTYFLTDSSDLDGVARGPAAAAAAPRPGRLPRRRLGAGRSALQDRDRGRGGPGRTVALALTASGMLGRMQEPAGPATRRPLTAVVVLVAAIAALGVSLALIPSGLGPLRLLAGTLLVACCGIAVAHLRAARGSGRPPVWSQRIIALVVAVLGGLVVLNLMPAMWALEPRIGVAAYVLAVAMVALAVAGVAIGIAFFFYRPEEDDSQATA